MALADILRQDPDVAAFGMTSNAPTFNNGRYFISLRPREQGRKASADLQLDRGVALVEIGARRACRLVGMILEADRADIGRIGVWV